MRYCNRTFCCCQFAYAGWRFGQLCIVVCSVTNTVSNIGHQMLTGCLTAGKTFFAILLEHKSELAGRTTSVKGDLPDILDGIDS